ncbi:MAG: hypothetical protein KDA41_01930, partial [Planctomycetales bacterium]|nr:hypothetical protein [Planctomycetales bacterium]
ATDGIPRLVNQVCDHALITALVNGKHQVDAAIVQEAWADLQRLPAPWLEPSTKGVHAHGTQEVIEFGSLDEDDAEPASVPFRKQEAASAAPAPKTAEPAMNPAAQLDAIEQQLAGFDDLEEVSSPPQEAVAAANPFADAFDEEEIVIDVYATLDEANFGAVPRVSSSEGRAMAQLFADHPMEAGQPQIATEADEDNVGATADEDATPIAEAIVPIHLEPAVEDEQESAEELIDGELQQRELTLAVAAMLEKEQLLAKEDIAILREPDLAIVGAPAAELSELQAEHAATSHDGDDRDMIIVQEHADDEALPPHVAVGRARRQQYRQLFARLRRS